MHSFNGSFGWDIGVDGNGNSYITGFFNGRAIFGLGEANETTLTSTGVNIQPYASGAGSHDIFVAKYNAGGALVWVKQAGGDSDDHGRGIAVEGSGNSYVTGYAGARLFVTKYDAAGALLWTKQADGVPTDDAVTVLGSGRGLDIGVDGSGNSYVTGSFTDDATFGPDEANETTLTSAGNFDIFVAKYDAVGALLWVGRAGGASDDHGRGIAVDVSGNSYVTGDFAGAATFGQGEPHETTLTSAGLADIFAAKFDPLGALLWAGPAGGASDDYGRGIAVDGNGNSYVTGDFQGSATFGATPMTGLRAAQTDETTLTSAGAGDIDIFVAKYGADAALAVTLGYVYAELRDGAIFFQWQTATESGIAGFNILTAGPNGFAPLNQTLIPSKAIDSVTPVDYAYSAATDAAVFYLEEVNIEGARERHGPFNLGQTYGTMAEQIDPGGVEMQKRIYLPLLLSQ